MKSKIARISSDCIVFENGAVLSSSHDSDCCEHHWLDFNYAKEEDFKDLEFDLSGDEFFKKIEDYGIELVPIQGHSIKIPGYGSNNGYYSTELTLVLEGKDFKTRTFDISECQVIND